MGRVRWNATKDDNICSASDSGGLRSPIIANTTPRLAQGSDDLLIGGPLAPARDELRRHEALQTHRYHFPIHREFLR